MLPYRIVFALLVWVGASVPLALVWNVADIMNLLMALPNLLALILLAGVAAALQREYSQRHRVRAETRAVTEQ